MCFLRDRSGNLSRRKDLHHRETSPLWREVVAEILVPRNPTIYSSLEMKAKNFLVRGSTSDSLAFVSFLLSFFFFSSLDETDDLG